MMNDRERQDVSHDQLDVDEDEIAEDPPEWEIPDPPDREVWENR